MAFFAISFLGVGPGSITGLMMLFMLLFVLTNESTIRFKPFLLFYILFFLYTSVIDFIKVDRDITPFKYLYTNRSLHFLTVLMILQLDTKIFKLNTRRIHKILVFIIVLSVVVIIIQQFYPDFFVMKNYVESTLTDPEGDLFSTETLRSPSIYSWGGTLGVGFIFIPFVAIVINNYLIAKREIMGYLFLFLGMIVAFLCKNRWVMVNALILFPMIFHYKRKGFTRLPKIIFIAALLLILVYYALSLFGINMDIFIADRLIESTRGGLTAGSASTRLFAFEVFANLFPKTPIWGVGNQITDELLQELGGRSSQIHVGFLSLLYYYGIIGGILYLGFAYYFTRSLLGNAKIHGYYCPLYSWVGFLIANLTLVSFIPFEAGIFLVLLLDKYYLQHTKQKSHPDGDEFHKRLISQL